MKNSSVSNFLHVPVLFIMLFFSSSLLSANNNSDSAPLESLGGDFVLHSARGDVALKDYRGKVVLLYFGYINCPDACPTTLSQWTKAFKKLTPTELEKVQGIMVSVDPERDTLAELDAFTDFFHDNIVGVSGSLEELTQVTALYGAEFKIQPHQPGKNYGVDHSFHVFVINPAGKLVERIDFTLPIDELVKLIRSIL